MIEIKVEGGLDIKSWCHFPEEGAIAQATNLAKLPFAVGHICLLPDTHQGYGMPIGGVLATEGMVVPTAVGVDIGCGVCAVQTTLTDIPKEVLKTIIGEIRQKVPVGFNKHCKGQGLPKPPADLRIVHREHKNADLSLGTLGQGNHFYEVQKSTVDGHIWIMVHSGSRNLGKQVADHYALLANTFTKNNFEYPESWDLDALDITSEEGILYLEEMDYCVQFALKNRSHMLLAGMDIFEKHTGCQFLPAINIAHNYARKEWHFNKEVIVHRKGATSASAGETGLIPGSQGTASYVVAGKGAPLSFASCSHGAGRKMGRKAAQRTLDLAVEQKRLDDLGVLHAIRGAGDLDEAAGAYKDIAVVMDEQRDLVDVVDELVPLAVIKG